MADPTPELLAELTALHRLTQTEAVINQTRQTQARDERIRRELADNLKMIQERAQRLDQQVRRLGGVPDAVGVALGRLQALAKATFEQGQPLDEAILGDLALEHQLRDRAVYAKVLAERANDREVVSLMERLEQAHDATIEWLTTRLAEVAVGGPAGIRPTPVQAVVGAVRRLAGLPVRLTATSVNRSVASAEQLQQRASETVEATTGRVRQLFGSAKDVAVAGRDASLRQAEAEAREAGNERAAEAVHETRANLGALKGNELVIPRYDELTATAVNTQVRRLENVDDLRAILAYEQAHKNRDAVVKAVQGRIEELAAQLAS